MITWPRPIAVDRLLDDLFAAVPQRRNALLPVDIHRTDDSLVVEASVPGFQPDEINVSVEEGVLSIEARREESREHPGQGCVLHERYMGSYYRQIPVGSGLKTDEATAEFNRGELTISIPLEKKAPPKRVSVSSAGSQEPQAEAEG